MKVHIEDRLEDLVEADMGGALTYEAMNLVLLQILRHLDDDDELFIEFGDGRTQKVRQLDNGWVGLRPKSVDREAVTKRVSPIGKKGETRGRDEDE